jgi:hypothetical protein
MYLQSSDLLNFRFVERFLINGLLVDTCTLLIDVFVKIGGGSRIPLNGKEKYLLTQWIAPCNLVGRGTRIVVR